jgi:hypothetical protein
LITTAKGLFKHWNVGVPESLQNRKQQGKTRFGTIWVPVYINSVEHQSINVIQ